MDQNNSPAPPQSVVRRDDCGKSALSLGIGRAGAIALGLGALLLMCAAPASAQITYTNTLDGTVNETVTPCTAPLLRPFTVPIHFTVADANIGVLMSHTYRGDLRLFIVHPDGTRITLGQNIGAGLDNLNVLFDDAAAAAYTTHTVNTDTATAATVVPVYQRTFRPLAVLSGFNGKDAFGTWTLEICDSLNADTGTFFQSDLILTAANAVITVDKTHSLLSDPVTGSGNPFHLPGAVVRYCLTIANAGPGIAHTVAAGDTLPTSVTYTPGTLRSGATCATATTVEDDNAAGADESDPVGASISGASISVVRPFMTVESFAVTFDVVVN